MIETSTILYAGRSDVGKKRQSNQDRFVAAELGRSMRLGDSNLNHDNHAYLFGDTLSYVFLVADGMGGHQAGNRASEVAIHYFLTNLLSSHRWSMLPSDTSGTLIQDRLKELLTSTHRVILADAASNSEYHGMGTTLTMAYIVWPQMWIVHAGDTRCYLLRKGALQQLTRDHTLANHMESQGLLSADQYERSPWSNVLWNALGAGSPEVVADVYHLDLLSEDRILLCSDGLNKHVDEATIQSILQREESPARRCEALIELANERGGSDNTTVIVADLLQPSTDDLTASVGTLVSPPQLAHRFSIDPAASSDTSTVDRPGPPSTGTTVDLR